MNENETRAVRKFFGPLDDFVEIRIFPEALVADLLRNARIPDKKHFLDLVINACVVGYHDSVLTRLTQGNELALYELCVSLNPGLDLSRVTLAVETRHEGLHLLEGRPVEDRAPVRLREIERELSRRVIGQEVAVAAVGRAVKKGLTGLRDQRRPIATFLFLGQTGVGKTELAKALTEFLYGNLGAMVRVDGSEFALPHEVAKLIGAPPGYVGHDQGGSLTEAMRQGGDRVVLFDEIEKSDVKVHDVLLQVVDEGFLTDGKGRPVGFNRAILVLTSNVGAEELEGLRHRIGFHAPEATEHVVAETLSAALRDRFRPEFINRLSEVIVFNPIGLDECERISVLMLQRVREQAALIPLRLIFSPRVPRFVAEKGFRPEFGARELRRTVEREVEGPLSEMLVDGVLSAGDAVEVRVRGDRLHFQRN